MKYATFILFPNNRLRYNTVHHGLQIQQNPNAVVNCNYQYFLVVSTIQIMSDNWKLKSSMVNVLMSQEYFVIIFNNVHWHYET